jgi:heterodisulfide reductase subunit B
VAQEDPRSAGGAGDVQEAEKGKAQVKLSYYPGCSLTGSAREYDESVRQVARLLGIELVELPDWNCCGASSAHMTDHELAAELSARNLELARQEGKDLLVPCSACFQRLRVAERTLSEEGQATSGFEVLHLTTLLSRPETLEKIRGLVVHPLKGLRVACYYGCLSMRPPSVTGAADYEDPKGQDLLVETLGAEPVRWSHKTECCSSSLTMTRPDIARALVGDIVQAARRGGAQALVTDCPMCQANVESRQPSSGEAQSDLMPVFFITELVCLALGEQNKKRRFREHLVNPEQVLGALGL